jgi:signal peptidase II
MLQGCNLLKKQSFAPLIASLVVISDFITKRMILKWVTHYESIDILPFINIVHVKNEGAAFGMFSSLGNSIFVIISIVAIIVIIAYLAKIRSRLEIFSISLILGGAIGNLIDRLTIGKVIDFIDFFVGKWHWPAFNVADSALTVGIILFLFAGIRESRKTE